MKNHIFLSLLALFSVDNENVSKCEELAARDEESKDSLLCICCAGAPKWTEGFSLLLLKQIFPGSLSIL